MRVATPGFPAATLDDEGFPSWITGLASEHAIGTAHVVRGLAPGDALHLLGVRPELVTPCQLPAQRPDEWTSLPQAAIGQDDIAPVLMAGQIGDWTFVYDDAGVTVHEDSAGEPGRPAPLATMLSASGREAATSTFTVDADTELAYAADGDLLLHAVKNVDPAADNIPAGLRAAIELAGYFEPGDDKDAASDCGINMRVLCALAGLKITLGDLRKIPLLGAPFS